MLFTLAIGTILVSGAVGKALLPRDYRPLPPRGFKGNATHGINHPRKLGKRCTGQIQSLSDVAAAEECTTIVVGTMPFNPFLALSFLQIGGFTVPAGETFALNPPDGASVSLTGAITYAFEEWDGPLFKLTGNDITCTSMLVPIMCDDIVFNFLAVNGGNHEMLGQGNLYWDGLGGSGGTTKPSPMLVIDISGSFTDLKIVNAPERTIAVDGTSVTFSGINIDNSAGSASNSASNGKPAGANTDGFDVAANEVTIEDSTVANQDDCLAINRGTSITFSGNTCSGGHGISIGSINSDTTVEDVVISGNKITNSANGLRIKTDATATGSLVSGVTYTNNVGSGITNYGVIIDQSYPSTLGTPGTGVVIDGVTFSGSNTISVDSTAHRVEVNCGSTSSCDGTWNFAGLTVTGGEAGVIKNAPVSGGSY
ncbi:Glycoside hydrolase family 31 protein [Mycena chlorophos]|uniref:endo-polygalacturonase n=1 Tax=Mycena chlorophos TaxID=658473 RepID=A0A8H6WCZ9_MYCCL|nr:Glycoside hydrolase family 31 protein [Mycena chlorophos]